jgi:hypothetical protein
MMRRRPWVLLLLMLSPGIWLFELLITPDSVPFFRGAVYSDLLISHLPYSVFIHAAIAAWGQVPLWNPLILSGAPLAADPLAGLWYPPLWLTFLFPSSLTFLIFFFIHMAWAGVGAYILLREEGMSPEAALLGGMAFSGFPKIIAHVGLGHVGLVSAVSWTPWVLVCVRRSLQAVHQSRAWPARAALAGASLGMLFIADPRWSLPAGLLALLYGLGIELRERRKPRRAPEPPRWTTPAALATFILFSLLVSACLSLPLLEFLQNATRAGMGSAEQSVYALPGRQVLGFILPIFSQAEWVVYFGCPLLVLAFVAVLGGAQGSLFWASTALAAILIALGDGTPFYSILTALIPGLDLLRVPARWMFLTGFSMAVLAARGLDLFMRGALKPKMQRRVRTSAVAIALFTVAMTIYLSTAADIVASTMSISVILASCTAALLAILHSRSSNRSAVLISAWLVIIGLDLAVVNAHLLEARRAQNVEPHREAIAQRLVAPLGTQRIFSPSYSIPQHLAARERLELADGVNPLQIDRYWDFMAEAVGFEQEAYSVTLPPFPSGDPRQPQTFKFNLEKLGMMNISYIAADYPLEAKDLSLLEHRDGVYLYQNPHARPRAWIEAQGQGADSDWMHAEVVAWSPNSIQIKAQGPGQLVVSEVSYPGWEAFLDGRKTELVEAYGLLRALELGSGEHQVELIFRPLHVRIGAAVTLMSLIALGGLWLRR